MNQPRIVILGAGYGGMMTAQQLTKQLRADAAHITLVNKHNYHYQTTWLHEAAAGTLHHDRTRMLIRNVINTNRIEFVQDIVKEIQPKDNKVILENGTLDYDYIVIALGFDPATFGIKGIEDYAFSIQSIDTVRKIREHIEYQFASYHYGNEHDDARLNIIVGGGGFTGVEFVGELAQRVPELCQEYDIDRDKVRVINIEGSTTILAGFEDELASYAKQRLESKGVEFKLGYLIKEVKSNDVIVEKKDGGESEEIHARTVVWTGGVRGNTVVAESGFEVDRGKIPVRQDLRSQEYDNVFVIGDCALLTNPENDQPYPPTAQIAIQQSYALAANLKAVIQGQETEPFDYHEKGTVASLGEGDAIGKVGNTLLKGFTASALKKIIDDRYLLLLGGPSLLLKKGKFNFLQ
ncbi:NAD(P)/FAD-dependent oxidoreductase [Tuberibacillus sp. Marseille-P3662]|uniref:NAD(P)/FAD-dependent oxidoreductase n=1 Tax=Tuberibacillus sp. Marseille-P3662 TaxID=1965358 RepID=UPI000A1C8D08|nr:NAD(P)/FAD-dependent oxidoreductase [Tuberibacillus sp. Marseille-P3662]